ncbi:MAG TPA: EF-P lysine aminoacylase EpmA [Spirochaetota bacterium]|nr:EF-P lysine aminoacylase EpmA [Spirochaetota bacterium]HOS54916.1 EF-P lysine aminoacylase EpmA [Spirochaetota bacterium]HQF77259.1 EF-P lysine aminoacylase EpmA [Spirochaetota bacterium]HQH29661.1 EF-P lysine aminoacylase EpmA [Spirochaetota bacterium]HRU44480.1 EF-P lysine aminoacylase EpmA [Spirochaetota bacterium]
MLNPVTDPDSFLNRYLRNNVGFNIANREKYFKYIREFFSEREFIELHTPTLTESPGIETYIEPFQTTYYAYNNDKIHYYLPTSPEFSLKEALTLGYDNIYEIAKVFRNSGEKSQYHSPEFFMLEWYRAYANYEAIIEDCSRLLKYLSLRIYNNPIIKHKRGVIDLSDAKTVAVKELFEEYGINLDLYSSDPAKFIKEVNSHYSCDLSDVQKDDVFFKFFMDKIEPTLGYDKPVFVCSYPIDMCGLSNVCKDNALYGERFELYILGIECANGFGELTDPVKQKENFEKTLKFRNKNAIYKLSMPNRFIKALKYGIPPCSGVALGLERLFMILFDVNSIEYTRICEI